MSLLCYPGRHKPSMHSLSHGKHGGYVALCEGCGVPMERAHKGPWRAAAAVYNRAEHNGG